MNKKTTFVEQRNNMFLNKNAYKIIEKPIPLYIDHNYDKGYIIKSLNTKENKKKNEFQRKKNIKKHIFKQREKYYFLNIINILIFFLSLSMCKQYRYIRKINLVEELIITINMNSAGEKQVLSSEYEGRPNEIYLNGNKLNSNSFNIELNSGENIIKLRYNSPQFSLKNMFKGVTGIINIDFSKFSTSSVTDMENMFDSSDIQSLNLSNFDTSSVTNMKGMFHQCINLQSLDLSSFSGSDTNMVDMFNGCTNLKFVQFSETKTIKANNMGFMFINCNSLTSIDLSNFDTSSCTAMEYLFDNCYELEIVDLSSFRTQNVRTFTNMFSFCSKLQSIDLSEFQTASAIDMSYMFRYNSALTYVNLNSITINGDTGIEKIFEGTTNAKICYANTASVLLNDLNIENKCSDDCFEENSKLISESNKCVSSCKSDSTYRREYKRKCYKKCPSGTIQSSSDEFVCIKVRACPNYYNMDKTKCFDSIEDGYFLSDENQKLLDKCHENCKTCNKKEIEGNTNCLTCKNNNLFFYKGNCLVSCKYNDYLDNNKKICTCESNEKCRECSEENSYLCESCNEGFYSIFGENSPFQCYKELENYYLKNGYFHPCYSTCKKCSGEGNANNHNCDECKNGYVFINELNKEKNCYLKCDYYYYFTSNNEYKCTQTNSCPNEQNKLISEKSKCIDQCNKDDTYINEYNNECLKTCPDNTVLENNICKNVETEKATLEDKDTEGNTEKETVPKTMESSISTWTPEGPENFTESTSKIEEWSAEKFFQGFSNSEEMNEDEIINNIREDIINHKLDTLISNVVEEKKDVFVIQGNALFQITTSENQNNNSYTNVSSLNLGYCETILRQKYKIPDNETLIIFKIDYNITGLLIPIIGYEVYHPTNKSQLNLSFCDESHINYNIPVSINEDNLYKYDPNSEYYTDECSTYTSEDGTDILLNDRKEEFNDKNMSLCENICDYVKYNSETKKAVCQCGIRYETFILSELDGKTDLLSINFTTDNITSNMGAMKCYDLVFSKKGLVTNIGSYIMILIIIFHIISILIFYKCGYHIIDTNIQEILKEKKVLKKSNDKEKTRKTRKSNIYNLEQNPIKIKRKSSYKFSHKSEKSNHKRLKNNAPPSKKFKRKSSRIVIQENTNISSNQKSFTKLTLKETKIAPNFVKRRSFTLKSQKVKKNKEIEMKPKNINILFYSDIELNYMDYKEALFIDKRTYFQYYISLLKTKHSIMYLFYHKKDYNVFIIKLCLCLLFFSMYYALNTLFFGYDAIHKVYIDEGSYNISYFFQKIILSFIIAYHINTLIRFVVLSERNLLELKKEKSLELAKGKKSIIERCIMIKNICYFVFSISSLILFWYYLSSFCALYQNSQVYLIKNTFLSYLLGLLYPFLINLLPMIFRKFSLNGKNREFVYKVSKILQII